MMNQGKVSKGVLKILCVVDVLKCIGLVISLPTRMGLTTKVFPISMDICNIAQNMPEFLDMELESEFRVRKLP